MTASASINPARFLHEHLAEASSDLRRSLLTTMIDTLMSAEAYAVCRAAHGERSETGSTSATATVTALRPSRGTLDVAIAKLRQALHFDRGRGRCRVRRGLSLDAPE
jgi:putative transposase